MVQGLGDGFGCFLWAVAVGGGAVIAGLGYGIYWLIQHVRFV